MTENKVHTIHKKFQTDILEYNNGLMCAEFNYQKKLYGIIKLIVH